MNGFDRINAALTGTWPDKRPVMLHNFMLAAREAGLKMKEYYTSAENAARVHIEAQEKYELDGILLDIDTAVLASAVGVPVDYPLDEPARVYNAALQNLQEVDDLGPVSILENHRVQIALEAARILKRHCGDELYLRGNCDQAPFALASMMRTPELWMTDLLMDEARCFRLLDHCLEACLQFIDAMAECGVHMISNGDSPAGPDMISPEMYRTFAKPYEAQLRKRAHKNDLPYLIHICGDTGLILEDMKEIKTDAVELDYKTDTKRIHDSFKESITLFGTLDPSGVLANGTPELVGKKALELLHLYEDSPRLVINAGCAIPPTTPEANIRKLIDVTRHD
jgi:uroporphyrinogen decarboxylase